MYTISTIAPTSYQLSSLRHFHLPVQSYPDGSYVILEKFDSEESAKETLRQIAYDYYDEYEGKVNSALEDIEKFGQLRIEAVVARIDEVRDRDEVSTSVHI